jgi:hypothetical protein
MSSNNNNDRSNNKHFITGNSSASSSTTGFVPLPVPSQTHPTMQVMTHYDPCMAMAPPHPHSRMIAA